MRTRSGYVTSRVQQSHNPRRTTRIFPQPGMDRHVRFASRDELFSPPPDQDGDSVMGDSEYVPSEDGTDDDESIEDEDSDNETAHSDDVDTVMGDDSIAEIDNANEIPQTPTRAGPYKAGSVLLTPNKNRPRASGHGQAVNNFDTKVNSRYPSVNGNTQAYPPSAGKSKNRAYVLVPSSGRISGRLTGNRNISGPSNRPMTPPARRDRPPASLRRQHLEVPVQSFETLGPPSMWKDPVRWYRGENGAFVRDGSLPPEYFGAEHLIKVQPPRDDAVRQPAKLVRHDTEPLENPKAPGAMTEPPAQPPARRRRKTRAKAPIDVRFLRRSVRIREQRK